MSEAHLVWQNHHVQLDQVLIISASTTSKVSEQSKSFSVVILTYSVIVLELSCFDFRRDHAVFIVFALIY